MSRPKDEQKRISIFDATLTLVLQTGFTGLRMADVAKKAGVATGTVYKYFPSKENLIDDLFLHQKEIKLKEMTEGYQAGEPSWYRLNACGPTILPDVSTALKEWYLLNNSTVHPIFLR
jgi:AcrR family transcriptional regulator